MGGGGGGRGGTERGETEKERGMYTILEKREREREGELENFISHGVYFRFL